MLLKVVFILTQTCDFNATDNTIVRISHDIYWKKKSASICKISPQELNKLKESQIGIYTSYDTIF